MFKETSWHAFTTDETLAELKTDSQIGLSSSEAKARLKRYGENRLPESKPVSPYAILLNQFKGIMNVLLVVAAIIAFLIGEELDAAAILVVILLNGLFGFANEYRAERSIQALKSLIVPLARVKRDGTTVEVRASELVPGDVVSIETGDSVPADARLYQDWNMSLDESTLTGESAPVDKDSDVVLRYEASLPNRANMVYMGTSVVRGRGTAIVTATGSSTEIGRLSVLIGEAKKERTPLQERLDQLGRYMVLVALTVAAIVTMAGIARGASLLPMLETSLTLAIAAVPEGLPAVVTITLALGMSRMAKRKAIVRRLSAVETLGSTNTICTDKTGTLTQNQMTVKEIRFGGNVLIVEGVGYEPKGGIKTSYGEPVAQGNEQLNLLLRTGALCNDSKLKRENDYWGVIGDPTEAALLVVAKKAGVDYEEESKNFPRVKEFPFDTHERRMATIHSSVSSREADPDPESYLYFVKGSAESILRCCKRKQEGEMIKSLTEDDRRYLQAIDDEMASQALRVLAFAYKRSRSPDEDPYTDLVFLGHMGMIDPLRLEAKDSVLLCRRAGINVVMITGDHRTTAETIAADLGIISAGAKPEAVLEGSDLQSVDDKKFQDLVRNAVVYARVSPEHKVRIVRSLRAQGQIVAMTGDGVNDAPALEAADIGVSMGRSGTDVAREASDMILADDNFSTIVRAVEEGRVVFANVRKFIRYLFSCNFSEILIVSVATFSGIPLPLLPLQILWLNLVTDVFPALSLAGEPAESGMMARPPMRTSSGIARSLMRGAILEGVLLTVAVLSAFLWALDTTKQVDHATTVAFLTTGFAQLFHVFNSRFEGGTPFGKRFFSNRALWGALVLTIFLMITAVYLPAMSVVLHTVQPTNSEWLVIMSASILPAIILELFKIVAGRARPKARGR